MFALMLPCSRCGKYISMKEAESCWYCLAELCYECWDKYGHCGHKEAGKANEKARQVPQPKATP